MIIQIFPSWKALDCCHCDKTLKMQLKHRLLLIVKFSDYLKICSEKEWDANWAIKPFYLAKSSDHYTEPNCLLLALTATYLNGQKPNPLVQFPLYRINESQITSFIYTHQKELRVYLNTHDLITLGSHWILIQHWYLTTKCT